MGVGHPPRLPFFTAEAADYRPHATDIYADAYGSSLVTRNMGIDTIECCYGRGEAIMEGLKRKTTRGYHIDRTLACLVDEALWPDRSMMRFAGVPPMAIAFPTLRINANTLPSPPAVVDLSGTGAAAPSAASGLTPHAPVLESTVPRKRGLAAHFSVQPSAPSRTRRDPRDDGGGRGAC